MPNIQVQNIGGDFVLVDLETGQVVDDEGQPTGAVVPEGHQVSLDNTTSEESLGVWGSISEIPAALSTGFAKGLSGIMAFPSDIMGAGRTEYSWDPETQTTVSRRVSVSETLNRQIEGYYGRPESTVGGLTEGVTKFGTGFIAGGPIMKLVRGATGMAFGGRAAAAFSKGPGFVSSMVQGAIGDVLVASGEDREGVAAWVKSMDVPMLSDVFGLMTAGEGASVLEVKLMAAIEGTVLGGVLEAVGIATKPLVRSAGKLVGARTAAERAEAAKALRKLLDPDKVREADQLGDRVIYDQVIKATPEHARIKASIDEGFDKADVRGMDSPSDDVRISRALDDVDDMPRIGDTPVGMHAGRQLPEWSVQTDAGIRKAVDTGADVPEHLWGNFDVLTHNVSNGLELEVYLRNMQDGVAAARLREGMPGLGEGINLEELNTNSVLDIEDALELQDIAPVIEMARAVAKDSEQFANALATAKVVAQRVTSDAEAAARAAVADPSAENLVRYHYYYNAAEELGAIYSSVRTAASRGMNALRRADINVQRDVIGLSRSGKEWLEQQGRNADDVLEGLGGAERLLKSAQDSIKGGKFSRIDASAVHTKWWEKVHTHFINSILSGKSLMRNLVGNAFTTIVDPLTIATGRAMTGDATGAIQAMKRYAGLAASLHDAWQATRVNWKTGAKELSGADVKIAGIKPEDMSFAKRMYWYPLRTLTATDEFFQVLNARASMYDLLADDYEKWFRQALDNGLDQQAAKRAARRAMDMKYRDLMASPDKFLNDTLAYRVRRNAQVVTFTENAGRLAGSVKDLLRKFPLARLVVPFVDTPTNIIRQGAQFVPILPVLRDNWRKAIIGGIHATDDDAARLIGRQVAGSVISIGMLWAATNDIITGDGPPLGSPEREEWMRNHQPRSIRIPGYGWVSYQTLEPVSLVLGMMADGVQGVERGWFTDRDWRLAVTNAAVAVVRNSFDKTFTKSLSDVMDMVQDPSIGRISKFLGDIANGFIPFAGARGALSATVDPVLREHEGFMAGLRRGSLGLFPPDTARYALNGEKLERPVWNGVVPIEYMPDMWDDVTNEIAAYRGIIQTRPRETISGVELEKSEKSRYEELLYNTRASNGLTLYDAVKRYINSDAYPRPDFKKAPRDLLMRSKGALVIQKIFGGYRKLAEAKMMEENPRLQARGLAMMKAKAYTTAGDQDLANAYYDFARGTTEEEVSK